MAGEAMREASASMDKAVDAIRRDQLGEIEW